MVLVYFSPNIRSAYDIKVICFSTDEEVDGTDNTRATGSHTAGRTRGSGRQQNPNSPAYIAGEHENNEIGLVIRTRSQKAADGQVEELTSVETVALSTIAMGSSS